MIRCLIYTASAVFLTSCTAASAQSYDSKNPVHCLTIFGLGSVGALAENDTHMSNELKAWQNRIVKANGGMKWLERITPEAKAFAASVEKDRDQAAIHLLLQECLAS